MSDITKVKSYEGKDSNGLKKNWSRYLSKDMRVTSDKYRDGYDLIKWDAANGRKN